ncbi:MAG TPA: LytTR family transcriptional regulator [Bacteroidales bacterium]|jgi:hypothetical protein|nr:LytTR family transcriptional regulator [Bacteroidales bacterium]
MKNPKVIPEYFVTRRNTILQIVFTALFAFFFINIYRPFGAGEWYDVRWWAFLLASGALVMAGMVVVIISRLLMQLRQRRRPVTLTYYAWSVVAEIFFMGVLYAVLELVVLGGVRPFGVLLYVAVQNTSLILLIPYLISLLFFAWREKKMSLDALVRQIRKRPQFILFRDENEVLRLTIKSSDLIYLEASDNYVVIYFQAGIKVKSFLLRNTLKRLEQMLEDFPLLRCHRSYMVNIHRVKMLKRDKGQFKLWMDEEGQLSIPVSRSYAQAVTSAFENLMDV